MLIGEKIKAARKAKGYTLVELGGLINVSNAALSQIENGKTEPSKKTLIALCKPLSDNFGLDWLDEHIAGTTPALSKKEIAKDLSVEQLLSLKFGGGSESRSKADMRALARMLDEAIEKEERIMGYPEYKKK